MKFLNFAATFVILVIFSQLTFAQVPRSMVNAVLRFENGDSLTGTVKTMELSQYSANLVFYANGDESKPIAWTESVKSVELEKVIRFDRYYLVNPIDSTSGYYFLRVWEEGATTMLILNYFDKELVYIKGVDEAPKLVNNPLPTGEIVRITNAVQDPRLKYLIVLRSVFNNCPALFNDLNSESGYSKNVVKRMTHTYNLSCSQVPVTFADNYQKTLPAFILGAHAAVALQTRKGTRMTPSTNPGFQAGVFFITPRFSNKLWGGIETMFIEQDSVTGTADVTVKFGLKLFQAKGISGYLNSGISGFSYQRSYAEYNINGLQYFSLPWSPIRLSPLASATIRARLGSGLYAMAEYRSANIINPDRSIDAFTLGLSYQFRVGGTSLFYKQ